MIHIHNGDVVAALARRAGIPGEHFPFRESLINGPIEPDLPAATRARVLAELSGQELLRVSNDLFEQNQTLAAARQQDEVVLWFEHDLFCLVHFIYTLQHLGGARLSYVWNPSPIGELDLEAMFLLFNSRSAVTPSMLDVARGVWRDYTSPDPSALNRWIADGAPDFPFLRQGLTLHASRFPSTRNGLGAIEQRALALIAGGPIDFMSLFPRIDPEPPRFGFGDADVLRHLRAMAGQAVPLITMTIVEAQQPPKAMFTITPVGERVVAGEVDVTSINDPDVWLGGVHVTKENLWRFDGTRLSL
jgi:hypothetical protein